MEKKELITFTKKMSESKNDVEVLVTMGFIYGAMSVICDIEDFDRDINLTFDHETKILKMTSIGDIELYEAFCDKLEKLDPNFLLEIKKGKDVS